VNGAEKSTKIDVELSASLKDRLTSLQSAVNKEEVKKPVVLVDIQPAEELVIKEEPVVPSTTTLPNGLLQVQDTVLSLGGTDGSESENLDTDREDSGIHTTDVSCSVSQADEQNEERIEELNHIEEHKETSVEKEMATPAVVPDLLLAPQVVQMETVNVTTVETCVEHQEQQFTFTNDTDDAAADQQDISVSAETVVEVATTISLTSMTAAGTTTSTNPDNKLGENGLETVHGQVEALVTTEGEPNEKVVDDVVVVVTGGGDAAPQVIEQVISATASHPSSLPPIDSANDKISISISYESIKSGSKKPMATEQFRPLPPPAEVLAKFSSPQKIGGSEKPAKASCIPISLKKASGSYSFPSSPKSPASPRKGILDFIKHNIFESSDASPPVPQESAKFYLPLDGDAATSSSTTTMVVVKKLLEKADSCDTNTSISNGSEISKLLDAEFEKL
jgi:hypothetical protein